MDDTHWMSEALALADQAAACGEVPVGAVVVRDGEIIGRGFNRPIAACDPTAHAEIEALRDAAARVGNYRLPGAVLYVTVEPCSMCAGAIVHSRIERLVYGAKEPKAGVAESRMRFFDSDFLNHRVIVMGGLMAAQAAEKMQLFFRQRRQR